MDGIGQVLEPGPCQSWTEPQQNHITATVKMDWYLFNASKISTGLSAGSQ